MTVTTVKSHQRRLPEKAPAYIETHLALMGPEDRIRFAQMHGLEIANDLETKREGVIERFLPWFRRRK